MFSGVNLDKAEATFRNHIENYYDFADNPKVPDKSGAYWRLGLVYERKGEFEKAKETYLKALEHDDLNGHVLVAIENIGKNINIMLADDIKNLLSKAQAEFDLNFLLKALESTHPILYTSIEEKIKKKQLDEFKKSLKDSISINELYKMTSKFVAEFGDGHTSINFPRSVLYGNLDKKVGS